MTNQQEISTKTMAATYGGLAAFGLAYNRLIDAMEETEEHDALVSLEVAFGVAVTVAAITPLIGTKNAIRLLAAFTASGLPMIIGSLRRWRQRRAMSRGILHASEKTEAGPGKAAALQPGAASDQSRTGRQ